MSHGQSSGAGESFIDVSRSGTVEPAAAIMAPKYTVASGSTSGSAAAAAGQSLRLAGRPAESRTTVTRTRQ